MAMYVISNCTFSYLLSAAVSSCQSVTVDSILKHLNGVQRGRLVWDLV